MKVCAIIQVRAGSTRLPNKAFLPLAGKSMTQNILERVKRASKLDEVVLAFPDTRTDADTTFADLAVRCGVGYYRGTGVEENDLVGRYLAAAKCYHADIVVRIPGDNPCVEPRCIDDAVNAYLDGEHIFFTNTTVCDLCGHDVDGAGAEVFSVSRLKWLDRKSRGDVEVREHPHKGFTWHLPYPSIRLDVNDSKDYEFVKMIYDHFGHNRFTVEEVLSYLDHTKEGAHVQA